METRKNILSKTMPFLKGVSKNLLNTLEICETNPGGGQFEK